MPTIIFLSSFCCLTLFIFLYPSCRLIIYRETEIAVIVKCVHGRICLSSSVVVVCFSVMLIIHITVTSVVLCS